jgi:hypothetical protein
VVSDPSGTNPVPGNWYVSAQDPQPGAKVAAGTNINLTAMATKPATCP